MVEIRLWFLFGMVAGAVSCFVADKIVNWTFGKWWPDKKITF